MKGSAPPAAVQPAGLSAAEAAKHIGVSLRAFHRLVASDAGLARARRYPTRRPVYVRSIVEAWLADGRRGCPTTPARIDATRRTA